MIRLAALALALLVAYLAAAPRLLAARPGRVPAVCPACGYRGCDGSLSQCPERWR